MCKENRAQSQTLEVLTQHLLKQCWPEFHSSPMSIAFLPAMRLRGPNMSPWVQAPGGMSGVLLHHSLLNSLEAGSSTHTLSKRVTIEPRHSSCLHSLSTGVTGVHMATPRFFCGDTWDLNSGSDACVLSILPTSHVTRLLEFFIALNSSSHPVTTMLLSL